MEINFNKLVEKVKLSKSEKGNLIATLATWKVLNEELNTIEDETTLLKLIKLEKLTENRTLWILRIKSRYNLLRNKREKLELNHNDM